VNGAALYLHLRALGLELAEVERPEHPDGRVVRVCGLARLEPGERERISRLMRANKAALMAVLSSGAPGALAVRQEASYGSSRRSREQAA